MIPMPQTDIRPYAIYTRKSVEDDVQKELTSCESQAMFCKIYAQLQQLPLLENVYEDYGKSGGNMDRPAFQRLLKDIACGEIGGVLVYKLDRLTRSLNDFAGMIDAHFKQFDVKFISVTEQFDTSTPQGVLILNMMLSMAQFERQQTSARTKDKVKTSKERGLWMGGFVPLGYKSVERKLVVDPELVPLVQEMFEQYLRTGSIRQILRFLHENHPELAAKYSYSRLQKLLQNPLYKGFVQHHGTLYPGQHEAVITEETWDAVQQLFKDRATRYTLKGSGFLLTGKCFCRECQVAMSPTHTKKNGARYVYLSCLHKVKKLACQGLDRSISAAVVETKVMRCVGQFLQNPHHMPGFASYVQDASAKPEEVYEALKCLEKCRTRMTAEETKEFLNTFVERVEIGKEGMWVTLTANRLSMKLPSLLKKKAGNLSMEVMIKGNWHVPGDRQQSFLEEGEKIQTDEALRKAFLKTQQWIEMIEKGCLKTWPIWRGS